jgi:hypothetical protein
MALNPTRPPTVRPTAITALLAAALAAACPAHAEDPPAPTWRLGGAVWTQPDVVSSEGQVLGASVDLRRSLGQGPFFVGGQVTSGWSETANQSWVFDRWHTTAAAAAGAAVHLGAGQAFVEVGAGGMWVQESYARHQAGRLGQSAGAVVAGSSFSIGPYAFGDAGMAVTVVDSWSFGVSGGPTVAAEKAGGEWQTAWGWHALVGVGYDF